ncbi:MFS transporter [Jhaorihella thermophila]|nr:MFS transporter [Jhaorihella thermophila]
METAPDGRRGVTGSWANVGSMTGSLLGVGAAALVANFLDAQALHDWGWRLPFLGGSLLGVTAIWIRRNLHDSRRFAEHHAQREETSPLLEAFTTNRRETILALIFAAGYGTCYYIAFVFLPEWLTDRHLMARGTALAINTAATLAIIPLMPLFAIVGDRWLPRRTWIALAILVLAVLAVPLYLWMLDSGGSLASVVVAHAAFFGLLAVPLGSAPALFVEMFPEPDRLSGYSVAFNVGVGVFGGMTPMISTSLMAWSGSDIAPAIHFTVAAAIAILALALTPDRSRDPLR